MRRRLRLRRPSAFQRSVEVLDGPDLDRSVARPRDLRSDGDGLIEVPRLDQVVPAELFLGLREGPVRGEPLAVADPDGGRGAGRLQGIAALDGAREFVSECAVLGDLRVQVLLALAHEPPLSL